MVEYILLTDLFCDYGHIVEVNMKSEEITFVIVRAYVEKAFVDVEVTFRGENLEYSFTGFGSEPYDISTFPEEEMHGSITHTMINPDGVEFTIGSETWSIKNFGEYCAKIIFHYDMDNLYFNR